MTSKKLINRIAKEHNVEVKEDTIEKIKKEFTEEDFLKTLKENYELIKLAIKEYIDIKEDYLEIITIWIIGTYFHKDFQTYPYLFINAMRGSAKTRLLKLIAALEKDGEVLNSLTESVLFRQNNPLGIDEFESIGNKEKASLRQLLNSSYKKGSKVKRMKKKKSAEGEEQVVEEFDVYRPIHLANIWGMEEVLGDRCISIFLEKSSNKAVTKLMEDYDTFPLINQIKDNFAKFSVVWCSVVTPKQYTLWHHFIKKKYEEAITEPITTLYIKLHKTTLNYTNRVLFEKIDESEIDGRNLELFFPLFLVANRIGETTLTKIIEIAKKIVSERKIEEFTESKDVLFMSFIARQEDNEEFRKVKELTTLFRAFVGEEDKDDDWLNTKWVGRALKRLSLIKTKRRYGEGIQVILDVKKAQEKMKIFNV